MPENKLFFMPNAQLLHDEIKSVRILKGCVSNVDGEVFLPRVVINDILMYEGAEGSEAIVQLKNCEFYSDDQFDVVSSNFKELMKPLVS